MTLSLNEIEAQAKRAARGAGLSWGMAEEAGRAARWLASHDLPGSAHLADVLAMNDGLPQSDVAPVSLEGDWHAAAGALCPLAAGSALNDCADRLGRGEPVTMTDISCPLLVLPFAAWAAIHLGAPVQIGWESLQIVTDGSGIRITDPENRINAARAATLTCRMAGQPLEAATLPRLRGEVPAAVWDRLDTFAQRTFAPATEASRLLGAGTGGSDND